MAPGLAGPGSGCSRERHFLGGGGLARLACLARMINKATFRRRLSAGAGSGCGLGKTLRAFLRQELASSIIRSLFVHVVVVVVSLLL